MNQKSCYFTNVPSYGNLYIEQILFEDEYPILFTLHNRNNSIKFICSCCEIRNEQRWILTPVDIQNLIPMLRDKMTIHDLFSSSRYDSFIVRWYKGNKEFNYTKITSGFLPEEDLPRKGYYLEADGEFEEYANVLNKE